MISIYTRPPGEWRPRCHFWEPSALPLGKPPPWAAVKERKKNWAPRTGRQLTPPSAGFLLPSGGVAPTVPRFGCHSRPFTAAKGGGERDEINK